MLSAVLWFSVNFVIFPCPFRGSALKYAQLPCHKRLECDSKDSFMPSAEGEKRTDVYALPVNIFILWLFMGRASFIFTQFPPDSELYDVFWSQGICGKKKERFYESCVVTEVHFVARSFVANSLQVFIIYKA